MSEEYTPTQREIDAFHASKNRPKRQRPELNRKQLKVFFELVATLSTHSVFDRRLNLTPQDVEFYKKKFDIVSERDARIRLREMEAKDEVLEREQVIANVQESREAEAIANKRLEDMALAKLSRKPVRIDKQAIQAEDKERQRRLSEQEAQVLENSDWRLPLSGSTATREEELNRFRNDIERRGLSFTASKHGCEKRDIRAEAKRLMLKIDWDRVRR